MRTVTFSSPEVAKAMNELFVCAWRNKRPDAQFPDGAEKHRELCARLTRWDGISAVTSLFATADGLVLHAMPGYLDVLTFRKNLEFARALYGHLYLGGVPRNDADARYKQAHLEAALQSKDSVDRTVHKDLANQMFRVTQFPMRMFRELDITR